MPASSSCGMTTFLLDRDLEPFFRDDVERLLGEEDDPSSSVRSPPGLTPSENITCKVATYHIVYHAEPKEPTQFGSVSGSEIQNSPCPLSGIVSLPSEPKEPA